MEDKINEIKKQMEDATKQMNEKMDPILNNYQSQINSLREQYNNRISELESQGFLSSDVYMDEQLIKLNNEITRLTIEADRVFEDLNKELDGKIADLNKQLEFEEDKARRIGEKNKELDARMNELEQQGMSYGEMQLDSEVIRLQNEIEAITNELSEEEKAQREDARKLAEEKQKQEKEKNDAIKEYGDLKEQKADFEKQLEEAKKQLETQNASLEQEKAGRLEVMKQLEARNNTDSPEYKEYAEDIKRIEELLSKNSKKANIDEFTKNIADIEARMTELEGKFGKEVLEPVVPEPQQPIPEPQPQQPVPEPEPEPQPRQYGRRMNSEPKSYKQVSNEDKESIKYEKEPLTATDCFEMAKAAYAMMTDEDKAYLEYAKNQLAGPKYFQFMQEQFPQLLQGNTEVEQRMICDMLNVIHNNEVNKAQQPQPQPQSQPQPQPQPQLQPQPQPQPQQAPMSEPINMRPERTLYELMQQIKLDTIGIDLSTGDLLVEFNDNGKIIDWDSYIETEVEKVNLKETRDVLTKMGLKLDKNMDPMMVKMICNAIDDKFEEFGIDTDDITLDVYEHYINQYKNALNLDAKDENLAEEMPFIAYIKTDKDFVMNDARGKGLDKIFRKYIRQAEYSPCVKIDESIDTRNWLEKLTDRVRSIFKPNPRIAENINEAMRDHQDDEPEVMDGEVLDGDKGQEPKKSLGQQLHEQFQAFRKEQAGKVVTAEFKDVTHEQGQPNPQKDDHDDMEQ